MEGISDEADGYGETSILKASFIGLPQSLPTVYSLSTVTQLATACQPHRAYQLPQFISGTQLTNVSGRLWRFQINVRVSLFIPGLYNDRPRYDLAGQVQWKRPPGKA